MANVHPLQQNQLSDDDMLVSDEEQLARLLAIRDEAGPNALTEEESISLADYYGDDRPAANVNDFPVNLAELMEEKNLDLLAQWIIEWTENDKESRQDWEEREAAGLRLLGISEKTEGGAEFIGASRVVHPGLAEACIQFQARAMGELFPAGGPVKTIVLGDVTPEREDKADRVKGFMNYQYTDLMPGAFDELDMLLFRLPLSGSCFKKVLYDPIAQTNVTMFVEGNDFFVPYAATNLRNAPRFTHRLRVAGNDVKKLQSVGYYRQIDLPDPNYESVDHETLDHEIDATEGREPVDYEFDQRYTMLECYPHLHLGDDYGFKDPLAPKEFGAPYVVTVDRDSQKTLSIHRCWRPNDRLFKRRQYFSHYKFLPGLGFYGLGFLHIAGGLSRAQTGTLRSILDAGLLANTKGGFKSRDAKIKGGDTAIGMAEWRDVDATSDELSKAFFPLPYGEPSKTLFELLGYLDQVGQRLFTTTESMVGEHNNNVPVGTTLARIEQGLKVFSGIHRRCHVAQREEFDILADLNGEYLPDEYPYDVPGESRQIFRNDFDGSVAVQPVSDPNVLTNSQRVVLAQGVREMADAAPDIVNRKKAYRNLLDALRVPNPEDYIPDEEEIQRADPVSENAEMTTGRPVQVFPEQDHLAHIEVHQNWFAAIPVELQKRLEGAYMAHQAEHTAHAYKIQMEQLLGIPMAAEMDDEISAIASQVTQLSLPQSLGLEAPSGGAAQDTGAMDSSAADAQIKAIESQASIVRKDAESLAGIRRKDKSTAADIDREAMREILAAGEESNDVVDALGAIEGN